jgi:uncharacterized protein (DUF885 family)
MSVTVRAALILGLNLLGPLLAACQTPPGLEARRKALADLLAEQWEYNLRTNPIMATIVGDKRYNGQLGDFSEEAVEKDLRQARQFLTRLEAIDTTAFPEQEALNKELMARDLGMQLEGARFKSWEMPVSQMDGIHILLPELVTFTSFESVKDYNDYISRLTQASHAIDQTMALMRKGMQDGLMQPRFLLDKVAEQAGAIATQAPEKSPLAQPFFKFPAAIAEDDRQRLRQQGLSVIRDSVLPAYARLAQFVRAEYAPKGRTEPGEWSLPDGAARYAFDVKQSTTTNFTPEEIHQIGLAQVAEIEGRMLAVASQLGFKTLKDFNAAIAVDPKLHGHSRQEFLDLTRKYIDQMYTKLPELFGRLPKGRLEVAPVEEFEEKEASTHYDQGTPDGSRAARVMVVTGDFQNRLLTTSRLPRITRACRGTTCRLPSRRRCPACLLSASMNSTAHISRVGRSMRSAWEKRPDSSRSPTAITAICRTICCGPSAWSWIPNSTTSTGPASKWWTIFTITPGWTSPPYSPRPSAIWCGRGRP